MLRQVSIVFLLLLIVAPFSPAAAAFDTPASHAIVMDHRTGRVLYGKNIDEPIPTASMSKMVTVYMLLEELKNGSVTEDDTFTVSEKAWKKGGSKMFVRVNDQVRIGDLLRGIIVQSGNDASIVVAEGLSGTEEAFAAKATARMRELGLTDTTLKNATGWPDPDHRMSVHDLARVAQLTIRHFPEHYEIYSEKSFTFSDIKQGNRNPVLYSFDGADGLKTGHTEEAGYGLTASAERDGHRLIVVLTGLGSSRERSVEANKLMQWAFRTFENYTIVRAGKAVDEADVWLGQKVRVPLVVGEDVNITMDEAARKAMEVTAVYEAPVPAPIRQGEQVGEMIVRIPDAEPLRVPLLAGEDVDKLGTVGQIAAAISYMVFGNEKE
ncbi:MAG: D-alanyl-D-alanine carboxypeptidase family protein [Minwuia sp.]|uniref:D-alanyl-D-alanine carboxypeptidase family protein n=1 Tax=Minwuia sp. TaxID=2493630 RepID=UPI003A8C3BFB